MFKCRNYIQVWQFFIVRKLLTCEATTSRSLGKTVLLTRFPTVVLTDESRANIRACGFASAGRHVAFIALFYL